MELLNMSLFSDDFDASCLVHPIGSFASCVAEKTRNTTQQSLPGTASSTRPLRRSLAAAAPHDALHRRRHGDGLVLRCKERLEANVDDLATTVTGGQTLLVLLFREAKVSTLRFDAAANTFRVFSLHWFEQHEKRTRPQCTPTTYNAPRLFVDPDGRCIFVLVYDRLMWVIPLVCGAGLSAAAPHAQCQDGVVPDRA